MKILVIGSVNVDFVSKVKTLPKGNEDIKMEDTFARISGFGWNVCNVLKTLNVSYDLLTSVGTLENGEYVRNAAEKLNIPLLYSTDQIEGCTYTLVDQNGKTTGMVIPGGEYTFPYFDIDNIYLDDYDAIICSDLEMPNEFLEEYLQFLESYDGPVYYATCSHGMVMNEDLRNILYSINPVLIMRPEEIFEFTGQISKDIVDAARLLSLKTSKQVTVYQQAQPFSVTSDVINSSEEKEEEIMVDESGCMDTFAASYMIAKATGVIEERALSFAANVALITGSSYETIPPQSKASEIQEEFLKIILN